MRRLTMTLCAVLLVAGCSFIPALDDACDKAENAVTQATKAVKRACPGVASCDALPAERGPVDDACTAACDFLADVIEGAALVCNATASGDA